MPGRRQRDTDINRPLIQHDTTTAVLAAEVCEPIARWPQVGMMGADIMGTWLDMAGYWFSFPDAQVCMKSPRACSRLICWCIMVTWCFMPLIAQPLNPSIGGSMEQKPHQFLLEALEGRASNAFLAMPGPECYLLGRSGDFVQPRWPV